jgi:hypothetical protein
MALKKYNTTIRNLENRLRSFSDSLPAHIENAVRNREAEIVDGITWVQLYNHGINGKGRKIMEYAPYRPKTIQIKRKKGQPTNRVTLRDTGDFHDSVYVVFDSEGFQVVAEDGKTDLLINKYGKDILRLTDENLHYVVRIPVVSEIIELFKQAVRK